LDSFLADFDDRLPWKKTSGALKATEILRGSDGTGLTVVLAEASSEPSKVDLQGLWRMRAGRSADPVLVLTTFRPKTVNGSPPRTHSADRTPTTRVRADS
jgi:hypothetical protein